MRLIIKIKYDVLKGFRFAHFLGGKAMNQFVRVYQCPGGLIHLSIGMHSLRLEPQTFHAVAQVLYQTSLQIAGSSTTKNFQVIAGGKK